MNKKLELPVYRYQNDPLFKRIVDLLYTQIVDCNYTATELREAAVLAAIMYEQRHGRRLPFCVNKNTGGDLT